jgi:hypothetical protein
MKRAQSSLTSPFRRLTFRDQAKIALAQCVEMPLRFIELFSQSGVGVTERFILALQPSMPVLISPIPVFISPGCQRYQPCPAGTAPRQCGKQLSHVPVK